MTRMQLPGSALRDQLRKAKVSCESTSIILDVALICRGASEAPSAEELENLRDTASRTIAACRSCRPCSPAADQTRSLRPMS
jgi:hypothetical protein